MKNKPLRGFQHLIGETIKKIDATGINHVNIETESSKIVAVCAEQLHYGIPIIDCVEMESQFVAKVKK